MNKPSVIKLTTGRNSSKIYVMVSSIECFIGIDKEYNGGSETRIEIKGRSEDILVKETPEQIVMMIEGTQTLQTVNE